MRIEQLEYVSTVARLGSFRKAAVELHISQPALSETVRKLERELGVDVLDRRRSGATLSESGRALLPHMIEAIEAVDRLRQAAGGGRRRGCTVRVGTVSAATVPLMTPTIQEFHDSHPETAVEIVTAQQDQIHRALLEGGMDIGLVNYLGGDDLPPELESTELLRGRPVACMRPDSPLAARAEVSPAELLAQPLVAMRPGYLMYRYLHRLGNGAELSFAYSADGAEMGKLMVAAGLGVAVLPDYSVRGDPLERRGDITYREIAGEATEIRLVAQLPRSSSTPRPVRELHDLFVARARALS